MQVRQPRLFSLSGIVIGTLIGSMAVAVYMLTMNYVQLGKPSLAKKVASLGTGIYLGMVGLGMLIDQSNKWLSVGVMFLQLAVATFASYRLQGATIAYHQEHGGLVHSAGFSALVGLAVGFILFASLVLVLGVAGLLTKQSG